MKKPKLVQLPEPTAEEILEYMKDHCRDCGKESKGCVYCDECGKKHPYDFAQDDLNFDAAREKGKK